MVRIIAFFLFALVGCGAPDDDVLAPVDVDAGPERPARPAQIDDAGTSAPTAFDRFLVRAPDVSPDDVGARLAGDLGVDVLETRPLGIAPWHAVTFAPATPPRDDTAADALLEDLRALPWVDAADRDVVRNPS